MAERRLHEYTPEQIEAALIVFIQSGSANGNEQMRRWLLARNQMRLMVRALANDGDSNG